jgi:hypothetical protein
MIETLKRRLSEAPGAMRAGLGASGEDMAVATLVAAPFAATFGIWLSWATWWPNLPVWIATAIVLVAGAFWAAGLMLPAASVDAETGA